MSDPRYHTTRWRKIRKAQLRKQPLCEMCLQLGRVSIATVADHKEPHRGDEQKFWHGELQSLDAACHSRHKQRQEKSGTLPGATVTGEPLDPDHYWNRTG